MSKIEIDEQVARDFLETWTIHLAPDAGCVLGSAVKPLAEALSQALPLEVGWHEVEDVMNRYRVLWWDGGEWALLRGGWPVSLDVARSVRYLGK